MENTILMTQPKNPEKPSPEPRENYLTYSVNYTNFRADALSGATENRKLSPAIFRVTRAKAPKLQNPTEFSYLTTQMNRILRIPPNGISYPPKNFRKQPSFPEPRGAPIAAAAEFLCCTRS